MGLQNKAAYCEMVKKLFKQMDDDNAGTLFSLLDMDQSGVVEVEEFVEGCCRLRGVARSIDLHRLSKENGWMRTRMLQFMKYVESQIGAIREALLPETEEGDSALSENSDGSNLIIGDEST